MIKCQKKLFMLQALCGDEAYAVAAYLNVLNDLRMESRIFRMIQEAGILKPLKMETQS
jgi:hypothetical protein